MSTSFSDPITPPSERPEYESFREFARLTRRKRQLVVDLKQIEGKLDVLQYQLRDYLGEEGWEKVTVDGFTIFLRRQLYVRHRDFCTASDVVDALKRNQMGHFVKEQYNVATLSKHIRELEELHKEQLNSGEISSIAEVLPQDLIAVLNIDPQYTVVALERGQKE
jgi:hypothetical protein